MSIKKGVAAVSFSAFCAAITLGLTGCNNLSIESDGFINVGTYGNADKYTAGDFTYGKGDITALDIDWSAGEVKLVEKESDTLSVTETSGSLEDKYKMHWMVENSTLYIKFWESGLSGKVRAEDKKITVEIPQSLNKLCVDTASANVASDKINAADTKIDTSSGNVEIGELNAKDVCEIETASGNIDLDALDVSSGCDINSSSGNIDIDKLSASKQCDMESSSGRIKVKDLTAPKFSVDSSSGNIELNLRDADSGSIDSSSGDVDITLLGGKGATVEFDGMSGTLNGKKSGTYTFGDGACKLVIDTSSGNVRISEE